MKRERFSEEYFEMLKEDSSKTHINLQNIYSSAHLSENIINTFCHPDVVNKVTELFLS